MGQAIDNRKLGFDPRTFDTDPVEKAYRDALADGLERALERGVVTLEELMHALNKASVTMKDGTPWTEQALAAELARLGR
jgi:hypothetical protein